MAETSIEWADSVWNPVVGCAPVSAGCLNCYAATMARRHVGMGTPGYQDLQDAEHTGEILAQSEGSGRPIWDRIADAATHARTLRIVETRGGRAVFTGSVRCLEHRLGEPLHWRKPRRIFVCSMADLFHEAVPFGFIDRVFAVAALCKQHQFLVLTKRPERMAEYLNGEGRPHAIAKAIDAIEVERAIDAMVLETRDVPGFPGYRVSNMGTVHGPRSCLEPQAGEQGHCRVTLHLNGEKHRVLVHRLVLSVFDRTPRPGEQACHRNGDPSCNAIPNLSWGDQARNWADRRRHGAHRSYSKLTAEDVATVRASLLDNVPAERIGPSVGVSATQVRNIAKGNQWSTDLPIEWPIPAVWLGTSVEDQAAADWRIPHLLRCPAAVRFLSVEPLLGPVDMEIVGDGLDESGKDGPRWCSGIHWAIVGGESGAKARPCDVGWIRSVVHQCAEASVPCFVKQLGAQPLVDAKNVGGFTMGQIDASDHGQGDERCVVKLNDRKGGDPAEWPEDLRVRQMPEVRR